MVCLESLETGARTTGHHRRHRESWFAEYGRDNSGDTNKENPVALVNDSARARSNSPHEDVVVNEVRSYNCQLMAPGVQHYGRILCFGLYN